MGTQDAIEEEAAVLALFEKKQAKGRFAYRLFASSIFVGICWIWIYRILFIYRLGAGRWAWVGMFLAELNFGFYWICTQSLRWNITHPHPFKGRLSQSQRDGIMKLPAVDIFVCTADPTLEPPIMVMNTILSVMSYNYPTDKLSVYLSDDGGSELTFYALLEASEFAKYWIPFCKRNNIEPRSPHAYFQQNASINVQEWSVVKNLYDEMRKRIESTMERGIISQEVRNQHKGFSEWKKKTTKKDHQPIVQIVIDGRNKTCVDCNGCQMPTLVYLAREKRPQYPHHFKAGAMNALIRVSSVINNGSIILNVDCDMYANDPNTIEEALCFFMDGEKGHDIAYVQYPQVFNNITKNDIYANSFNVLYKVELSSMGGYGAVPYCGSGCFHRRESLSGKNYSKDSKLELNIGDASKDERTVVELEEASKVVAGCSYEEGTLWGKEMGLVYGCLVEDSVTGLAIQCRGWKSVCYNPNRDAFLGLAPITLEVALTQHKRWCEGFFQIFLSKYCPFIYGHGKLKLVSQFGYSAYFLLAPISLPTLYYVIVPPLCLLHGIPLFPYVSSPWIIPFAYVFLSKNVYSIVETSFCGSTIKAWWNLQRMWLIRRTTAYLFAFIDTIIKQLGSSQTAFTVTPKVVTDDALRRYEQEVMEFGSSNIMFTIVATLAMVNLLSLFGTIVKRIFIISDMDFKDIEIWIPQVVLCGLVTLINLPVYQALFFRNDKGRIPQAVMLKSIVLASLACLIPINGFHGYRNYLVGS